MKEKLHPTSVKLSDDLRIALEEASLASGTPKSVLIREAIVDYLKAFPQVEIRETANRIKAIKKAMPRQKERTTGWG